MKNSIRKTRMNMVLALAICSLLMMNDNKAFAQIQVDKTTESHIKLALNAFSFNDVLLSKGTTENPAFTLFDLLDWCAGQNIEALDITGYYFPTYPEVPTDEYIYELKSKAFHLGIDISGTGIRNNFASPDPAVRKDDVELAKKTAND